ncbi:MAG: Transcription-repair-coupling factor, partial [Planctomycetota bacterium]
MNSADPPVPTSLGELTALLASQPGFPEVLQSLWAGQSAAINGAWGATRALCISTLAARTPRRCLLVVQPTIRDAEDCAAELAALIEPASRVCHLPAWESIPEGDAAGDTTAAARLAVVRKLTDSDPAAAGLVVVASLPALLQPIPARTLIAASTRT